MPAASAADQVIVWVPGANAPDKSEDGVKLPSSTSVAEAVPRSTVESRPVASTVRSVGGVTTGSTSSAFGSLPSKYSLRLVRPSLSASTDASSRFGSRPLSVSNKSSIPSPSVSASDAGVTTVMVPVSVVVLSRLFVALNVIVVTPTANVAGASLVTSTAPSSTSVADTPEKYAAISGCVVSSAEPSAETTTIDAGTVMVAPTSTTMEPDAVAVFPCASVAVKVTDTVPTL